MPRQLLPRSLRQPENVPSSSNWGKANPLRGRNFTELAIKFKQVHPVGKILSQAEFDQWAAVEGLYSLPATEDRKSDAWLAHLQRRHQLRHNLNKAATHPRMNESVGAYVLVALQGGLYKVEPPHERIAAHEITSKVTSLVQTKRQQLKYLMQSADWTLLPPYEHDFAEALYFDIDGFEEDIIRTAKRLNTKFEWLAKKLKHAVESGAICPNNGGIRQFIAPQPVVHDATLEAGEDETEESFC